MGMRRISNAYVGNMVSHRPPRKRNLNAATTRFQNPMPFVTAQSKSSMYFDFAPLQNDPGSIARASRLAAAEYKAWLLLPWLGRITPCCDLPRKRAECVDADDVVVLGKYLWAFKARAVEDKDSSAIASIRIGRLFI